MMNFLKIKSVFSKFSQNLTQIRDTPSAIAGGVAIGVFMGFTPLFGFKTLLALLIAWLFRCSKVSAAVAVTSHDFVFPFLPLVLRWQYIIGFWLWYRPHHFPKRLKLQPPTLVHLFDWNKLVNVIWPMLIGSIIMAIPVSILFYFITLKIVSHHQEKKKGV